MLRIPTGTVLALVAAGMGLSGCAPQLKKLSTCTSGHYRYANPNGTTLPSLAVPSPDDLNGPPPVPAVTPTPAPAHGGGKARHGTRAPVASPPRRGAMLLPSPASSFRSC